MLGKFLPRGDHQAENGSQVGGTPVRKGRKGERVPFGYRSQQTQTPQTSATELTPGFLIRKKERGGYGKTGNKKQDNIAEAA